MQINAFRIYNFEPIDSKIKRNYKELYGIVMEQRGYSTSGRHTNVT